MRGIRLLRRRRVEDEGEPAIQVDDKGEPAVQSKKREVSSEVLEGIVFFLNSVIFLGLGTTILRLSDVANIYIERIQIVAPDYAQYVGYGYVIGYAMLAFSVIQMLFSALKLYEAKAARRVELILRGVEDDAV